MTQYRTTLLMSDGKTLPLENQIEGKYGAVCVYLSEQIAAAVSRHPTTGNWVGLIAARGIWGRYDGTGPIDQIPVDIRDGVVYATIPNLGIVQIEEIES